MIIDELVKQLHEGNYTLVVATKAGKTNTYTNRGVKDLYLLLTNEPDTLKDAVIADKVVGKGAAALMIMGGVKQLHTDVISEQAISLLKNSGIDYSYDTLVNHIINRNKDGWCPVETLCKEALTAEECLPLIGKFIAKMSK